MAGKKRSAASGLTSVVGGMLVGLDEQLLRATPRAEILVKRGDPIRGTSSEGGTLHVTLPDAPVRLPPDPSSDRASDEHSVPDPAVAEAGTELPNP